MGRTCILVLLLAAPLLTQCAPPPAKTQQAADAAIAKSGIGLLSGEGRAG